MGRKGVSKRKRAKEKTRPVAGSRKVENQPEQVTDKGKTSPQGNKK